MKLRDSMRSQLAERLCRCWIKRRHLRLAAPKVYVINKREWLNAAHSVAGRCHANSGYITLHIGPKAPRLEKYILLAHELTHYLDYKTSTGKWKRDRRPHGERFQRMLWGTINRRFWKHASKGHWIRSSSAHKPEYQP